MHQKSNDLPDITEEEIDLNHIVPPKELAIHI